MGSRVDYDAPGHSSTTMAYNADGTRFVNFQITLHLAVIVYTLYVLMLINISPNRLFSCGTNKEGESHIVEWNESEGAVKRTYNGLGKRSTSVVQFDTTKNRFLAAGDEFVIKVWDMDNTSILTTIDAEGGLPVLIEYFLSDIVFRIHVLTLYQAIMLVL